MDRYTRLKRILPDDTYENISNKTVCIVGVGGVGGYTVESLSRCGIKNIVLIDFDTVDITNINRQIIALTSTIGKYKVDVFKDRIHDIDPSINVSIHKIKIDDFNINILNDYKLDYLIDACDNFLAKKSLIKYALDNNIKFITSGGFGNKFNPELITITSLDKTTYDPMCRILRKWCKEEKINPKKIKVAFSSEKPAKTDSRTPGSNSFVPSSAGLLIASKVFNDLKEASN